MSKEQKYDKWSIWYKLFIKRLTSFCKTIKTFLIMIVLLSNILSSQILSFKNKSINSQFSESINIKEYFFLTSQKNNSAFMKVNVCFLILKTINFISVRLIVVENMAKELWLIKMAINIKETGFMTCKMGKEH